MDINFKYGIIKLGAWFLMTKKELVAAVADTLNLTRADAEKTFDGVIDVIVSSIVDGDEVSIPGLGIFKVTERAERTGRNPQTGETITIAASKSVNFRVAKPLKDAINK